MQSPLYTIVFQYKFNSKITDKVDNNSKEKKCCNFPRVF